ncbi:butyrophilin subfamily 1 member A1-like isoform X1 [Dicentrarchus labrax]|uniref:butyrophilin subfamily 1 member A1-like isoform X1 n=1 Tax=Dicentrarchus labrax TaxID=13489 RepID=UPI0021F55C19|nr:butyrophilin subfamily 1 member A1-like isoform X1 [Dicentrarchus labrax]
MMPLLKDGLSFKPLLSSFTDVVFHHSVFILLLTQCCAGQSQVVGPSQPILATVGDDIILPCRLDPAADASDMTVEWSRSDLDPRFVHVWRDGVELENKKHPSYKGRTSVSINNLRHGDISLKLSKVKLSDDGKYKCFIPTLGTESTVDLVVGESRVIGPPQPIAAIVGDDIILPCRLEPAVEAVSMAIEWSRIDLYPGLVHVRRVGQNLLGVQNPAYEGRTSVSTNKLKLGDFSLKLSGVKLSDAGTYKCLIPGLNKNAFVHLVVGAAALPAIVRIDRARTGLVLRCESKGWYPEPEVVWLDGEGNLLSAGPTETVRGPDDLYTVSSRVTVEKRHSNNFICRVQQKDIHQTRETHIDVPEDLFIVPFSSAVRIGINFAVCFLCVLVLVFAVWKRRHPKIRNNTEPGEKKITYNSVAEIQSLMEGERDGEQHMTEKEKAEYLEKKKKKLSEALQRNEEECKDVVQAVDSLTEYKEALDKHKSELNLLSGCMNKQLVLVKRLLKEAYTEEKKTNFMNMIEDLGKRIEATKNLLEVTKKLLQKTEKEIGQKTERKRELELLKEQINKYLQENQRAEIQVEPQTEQPEREEW